LICKKSKYGNKKKPVYTKYINKVDVDWDKDNSTHTLTITFNMNIVRDERIRKEKYVFELLEGTNVSEIHNINHTKLNNQLKKKNKLNSVVQNHSTVTEWINTEGFPLQINHFKQYNSLICKFTLSFKSSTLTKTSHYSEYQEKLYNEVKRLKDDFNLGYRRISYVLYDKGYRGIRKNSVLRYNYIYSIYQKGKIREKRINRYFKTVVKDIMIYESR